MEIEPIARIHTDYPEKFGIPRQSGLAENARGTITFEPAYRNPDCIRGIEGYDYLWLIWHFDHGEKNTWSPTVRPPILGGNTRMGVFATRSPFRPNALGLSSVKLESVEMTAKGPVLHVLGADLRDGTEIFDIKPYVAYADCHEGARSGIGQESNWKKLQVIFPDQIKAQLSEEEVAAISELLELDPRPATHHDPMRSYAMAFRDHDVRFSVDDEKGELTVLELVRRP